MKKGGKTPQWNENFDIDVKYIGDDLVLSVLDQDMASTDLIGETVIKLSALCCNGFSDEWFDLTFKGKKSGRVHLKGTFSPQELIDRMATGLANKVNPQVQPGGMFVPQPHVQYQQ